MKNRIFSIIVALVMVMMIVLPTMADSHSFLTATSSTPYYHSGTFSKSQSLKWKLEDGDFTGQNGATKLTVRPYLNGNKMSNARTFTATTAGGERDYWTSYQSYYGTINVKVNHDSNNTGAKATVTGTWYF